MTLAEFFQKVETYRAEHPEQRYGQACFNVLAQVNPDLAGEIVATAADPFYVDFDTMRSATVWVAFVRALTGKMS